MENKSALAELARYVSMNVLGMLGLSCYILADTYFIAQAMGADGLAALNLAIPVYSFIQGCGLMVGMGGATRYSLLRGRGSKAADAVFTRSLYYAAALALAFFLTGLLGAGELAALLGARGTVYPMTAVYLRVILLFAPAFLSNNLLLCFVRNDGGPRLAMAAMVVGSLSNVALDYLFMFPLDMGIFGAALATGFAPLISMGILSFWFIRRHNSFAPAPAAPDFETVREVSALGAASLVAEVSAGVVMIVFNLLILGLEGSVGVAAYGVVANLSLVLLAIFTGVGQGIQPLVSRCCGQGRPDRSRKVYRYALAAAGLFAVGACAALLLFPGPVAGMFNREGDAQLQRLAEEGLRLYFLALPFAGFNMISAAYFSAMDRPGPGFLVSMLRGFLFILPLALVMSRRWGMAGVWLSFPAAEAAAAGVGFWLAKREATDAASYDG